VFVSVGGGKERLANQIDLLKVSSTNILFVNIQFIRHCAK